TSGRCRARAPVGSVLPGRRALAGGRSSGRRDAQTAHAARAAPGSSVSRRLGVVLDAGAFIALERRDKTMVALAQRLLDAATPLVTSAGVVAQVWRGAGPRQFPI